MLPLLSDNLIMTMGSIDYFNRAAKQAGGVAALQNYDRLFLIPSAAHDTGTFTQSGSIDPQTDLPTNPAKVPLPQPSTGRDELFQALQHWVENGTAPTRIEVASADGNVTLPLCSYPQMPTYIGTGPVTATGSYVCK